MTKFSTTRFRVLVMSAVAIATVDYDRLTRQADEQRSLIELVRLGAALKVISHGDG